MNYSASILAPVPPEQVARAIDRDLTLWWSTRVDRHPDGFTIRFNNSHVRFAYAPDRTSTRFVWHCTDAHMIINDYDPAEWQGTSLIWELAATDTGCRITLTHDGLTPALHCNDICVAGWNKYFEVSLRDHLNGATPCPETSAPQG